MTKLASNELPFANFSFIYISGKYSGELLKKDVETVKRTSCRKRGVPLESNLYIYCLKVSKESKNGKILF